MYKTIAVDFDDVLNNLLPTWIETLNKKHHLNVKPEDVTQWEMQLAFPTLTKTEIFYPLSTDTFWEKVTPKPDAIKFLKKLKELDNRIVITTSTYYKDCIPKFDNCLFKHFDYLCYKDIIICYQKDLIKCDYLIDDYEHNLKYSSATRLLFNAPHNKNANIQFYDYRVFNWEQIYNLIKDGDT